MSGQHSRTILFVSHNLQAIRTFCRRAILIDAGRIVMDDSVDKVLPTYLRSFGKMENLTKVNLHDRANRTSGDVLFSSVETYGSDGVRRWTYQSGDDVTLRFGYEVVQPVAELALYISISDATSQAVITYVKAPVPQIDVSRCHSGVIELTFPRLALRPGEFELYIALGDTRAEQFYDVLDRNVDLPMLSVDSSDPDVYSRSGYFSVDYRISVDSGSRRERAAAGPGEISR